MKKLPKDIQELLDNTPKMSEKSLKQLKKAAEELKNDSEFQKEVEEGIRENVEISKKLEEIRTKKEIENIAIPWSKFRVDGCHYRNILNVHLLKLSARSLKLKSPKLASILAKLADNSLIFNGLGARGARKVLLFNGLHLARFLIG